MKDVGLLEHDSPLLLSPFRLQIGLMWCHMIYVIYFLPHTFSSGLRRIQCPPLIFNSNIFFRLLDGFVIK